MANNLSALMPKMVSQYLKALSYPSPLIMAADRQYQPVVKTKGSSIDIQVSQEFAPVTITPGVVAPASPDYTPGVVTLKLDYWEDIPFTLTDDQAELIMSGAMSEQLMQNAHSMNDRIEQTLAAQYVDFYNVVGVPGTTPFQSGPDILADAGAVLDEERAFQFDRYAILNSRAHTKAIVLPDFQNADKSGSRLTQTKGFLGEKFNFETGKGILMPSHVAGTAAGRQVGTAVAKGQKSFNLGAAGTGTLVKGDVFKVSGDTGNYVVKSVDGTIYNFAPAARVPWAANAAITVTPSHQISFAMQRQALALVTALPGVAMAREAGANVRTFVHPLTGLAFTLEVKREHYQTVARFSCLWAAGVVRDGFGCRILG